MKLRGQVKAASRCGMDSFQLFKHNLEQTALPEMN